MSFDDDGSGQADEREFRENVLAKLEAIEEPVRDLYGRLDSPHPPLIRIGRILINVDEISHVLTNDDKSIKIFMRHTKPSRELLTFTINDPVDAAKVLQALGDLGASDSGASEDAAW